VTRPVSGCRPLVRWRQVVTTAMFTARLTVRQQLQTDRLRQQTLLQLLIYMVTNDQTAGVVHLQHGSMRRKSFIRSPSTAPKRWLATYGRIDVCRYFGCCPSAWRIGPMNLYTLPCILNNDGPLGNVTSFACILVSIAIGSGDDISLCIIQITW